MSGTLDDALAPPLSAYTEGSVVIIEEPEGTVVAGQPLPILTAHA